MHAMKHSSHYMNKLIFIKIANINNGSTTEYKVCMHVVNYNTKACSS